jgi:hypothetical protein
LAECLECRLVLVRSGYVHIIARGVIRGQMHITEKEKKARKKGYAKNLTK